MGEGGSVSHPARAARGGGPSGIGRDKGMAPARTRGDPLSGEPPAGAGAARPGPRAPGGSGANHAPQRIAPKGRRGRGGSARTARDGVEKFSDLEIFARIVAQGSLSGAARELDMSLAMVSSRLVGLEEAYGVRLLNRSTRSISLTEEGEEFHRRALDIIEQVGALGAAMVEHREAPHGRLKVTSTAGFGRRHIAPMMGTFRARYPQVLVELYITDAVVDLIPSGFDVAIRQSTLPDSRLRARRLAENHRIPCASPDYLARHGMPSHPSKLAEHDLLVLGDPPMRSWTFRNDLTGEEATHETSASLVSNDGEAIHAVALAGGGILLRSIHDVAEDVASGRLVRVLTDCTRPPHRSRSSTRTAGSWRPRCVSLSIF